MHTFKTKVRKWGSSIGVIIPAKVADSKKIKPGDDIELFLKPKTNTLEEFFGSYKSSKSTDEELREIDEEMSGSEH